MSAPLGFFDLPGELRFMIYRLLFCPTLEPILTGFSLAGPLRHSAQLLRVCRSCHTEASPVLYGENRFSLYWIYPCSSTATGFSFLRFFENIGPANWQFIRHLGASEDEMWTLEMLRARKCLRPMLENLESLSLKVYVDLTLSPLKTRSIKKSSVKVLRDVQAILKTQRGPYRKLIKAFHPAVEEEDLDLVLRLRLVSATTKPDLKVCDLVACSQFLC
jgi:hypothetical protein